MFIIKDLAVDEVCFDYMIGTTTHGLIDIKVMFQHRRRSFTDHRTVTDCIVHIRPAERREGHWSIYNYWEAFKHPKDNNFKAVGKWIALNKLLLEDELIGIPHKEAIEAAFMAWLNQTGQRAKFERGMQLMAKPHITKEQRQQRQQQQRQQAARLRESLRRTNEILAKCAEKDSPGNEALGVGPCSIEEDAE